MKTYKLTIFKGHPLIEDGTNIILIDSGAPSSIHHDTGHLTFLEETFVVVKNYLGLTMEKLSLMLGTKITTLMGVDILSKYKILFDYKNEEVTFGKNDFFIDGKIVPISLFMGIPIIEMEANGQSLNFFLDTGARLSYLDADVTCHYRSIGNEKDFYPGIGDFETPCHEMETRLLDKIFKVRYGNLPSMIQMTLVMAGVDGIIGSDLFNNFKIFLDIENERLLVNPL